jgi:hypothetical protein
MGTDVHGRVIVGGSDACWPYTQAEGAVSLLNPWAQAWGGLAGQVSWTFSRWPTKCVCNKVSGSESIVA